MRTEYPERYMTMIENRILPQEGRYTQRSSQRRLAEHNFIAQVEGTGTTRGVF